MALAIYILAQSAAPPPAGVGGTGQWLTWGIVLLGVALALFFVEVFLPSGGLIGIASGVSAAVGIFFIFRVDTLLGSVTAVAVIIALPFLIAFGFKVWPNTPFGKWVILKDEEGPVSEGDEASPAVHPARPRIVVGDTGKTLTPMHPVGTCLLHGRREECLAQGGTIPADTPIRVVVVDGNEVYVRAEGRGGGMTKSE